MKIFCFVILQFLSYKDNLLKQLADFQERTGSNQLTVSASIKNISDNQVFLEYNQGLAISPASTQKLITTSTALMSLGENFTFQTHLQIDGPVINNTLRGNVIITGNGDPTFGSPRNSRPVDTLLNEWSWQLKKMGIHKIEGKIIVPENEFETYDIPDNWLWGDIGNYYGAIPLDVNLNENYFTVFFKSGIKTGEPVEIINFKPFDKDWKIINQVKSAERGTGDQVRIFTSPLSNTILLKGTIPVGSPAFPVKGSIPNPPDLLQKLFRNALLERSISLEDKTINLVLSERKIIATVSSVPLRDLIAECNFYSINIYADALAKAVCRASGVIPTFENYEKLLKDFWLMKGVDLSNFELEDGSGLSPNNFISSDKMTAILQYIGSQSNFSVFFRAVPVVGKHGTVATLDKKKKTGGLVRAKSGSISKTRTYAGYFNNKEGKLFCFMFNISRYPSNKEGEVKAFLENILVNLIDLNQ
jgi:D-alanyl-D-alanine carboxypeptidase/D-alanyl-D-alanine-endopeptidase (penicillin-binding protein 4)